MKLKLAVQEQMVPGKTLIEKWELAQSLGYDAIEVRGRNDFEMERRLSEFKQARAAGVPMPTECVEMDHFIGAFDVAARQDAIANLRSQLTVMAQIGGTAVVTPAAWGMFSKRLPPMVPPRSEAEDREVLLEALRQLGEHAKAEGVRLLLEPLNRYEDHMVNTLAQAVSLVEEAGVPQGLGVNADTYQMNIEEDDFKANLEAAATWIKHVQLGDSSRFQPGTGHLDWPVLLGALYEIGYDGYMALECRLRGKPETALQEAAEFMRTQWAAVSAETGD
jgi:sugar phosphate isomerase/epimerase